MRLLLPVTSKEVAVAKLTPIKENSLWMQLLIEDGSILKIESKANWQDFENLSDCVVVCNDNEYVWPFIEYNMLVLVAHTQQSIDEIVEAYLFKELHELAY